MPHTVKYSDFFLDRFLKMDASFRKPYSSALDKAKIARRSITTRYGKKVRFFSLEDLDKAIDIKRKEAIEAKGSNSYQHKLESYNYTIKLKDDFIKLKDEFERSSYA